MFGIRKTPKVESEWQTWLNKRHAVEEELKSLPLLEAKYRYERAQQKASLVGMDAKALLGFRRELQKSPSSKELTQIEEMLRKHVDDCLAQGRTNLVFSEKQKLTELTEANQAAANEFDHLQSLEKEEESLNNKLEELKANPPEADTTALELLDKEQAQLESEKTRIREVIENMTGNSGDIKKAEQEEKTAQDHLDSIEAAAALGESSDSEQKSAATNLAKAKTQATKTREELERRAAACRGLESKLEKTIEQLEGLRILRAEVAAEVYRKEMQESEERLIAFIEAEEMQGLAKKLHAARSGYESAISEIQGRKPRARKPITVVIPEIKYHPYNHTGNAHGVDVTLKL